MISRYCRRSGGDRGASAIEYGLIIAGTILGLLAIVVGLRTAIGTSYSSAECKIGSASGCTSPSPTTSPTGTTSPTSTPTGGPTTSVTSVASSNLNPTLGETITLTATIVPATASGIVYFVDGTTAIGTATLVNGSATMSTSALGFGTHTITAVYTGSLGVTQSTSSAITVTVLRTTTLTLTFSPPSPASFGQSVTATATVTTTPSTPAPTGTVQFSGAVTGTVAVAGGRASVVMGSRPVGSYQVTASFAPSDGLSAPASATETLVVTVAASTLTLTVDDATAVAGQTLTFTATTAPSSATGVVTFRRNGVTIGTGTLVAGRAQTQWVATNVGGATTFTATYPGDANNAPATSNTVAVTVAKRPASITLTVNRNNVTRPNPVTFTAQVNPTSAPVPTGIVTFEARRGTTGAYAVIGTGTLDANGRATLTYSAWSRSGAWRVRATYAGDLDTTAAGPSSTVTVNVS